MKKQVLGLLAAGLLLSAGAAQAGADRGARTFIDQAQAQVQAKVDGCGPDVVRGPVKITAYVDPDGRLKNVHVDTTDGLRRSEATIAEAVRQIRFTDVPVGLIDAKLTFYVGHGG
ncbi:MAG: hypothetical protein JWP49_1530 [Phenylobacterium sp.]|nr:hypothetical protein [Phenylobacterium sp.]